MAHAWKACWVQALGGSNPPSSATGPRDRVRFRGFCCLQPRLISGRRESCPPASRPRRELRSARRLEARPGPAGHAAASNRAGLGMCARPCPPVPRQLPQAPFIPVGLVRCWVAGRVGSKLVPAPLPLTVARCRRCVAPPDCVCCAFLHAGSLMSHVIPLRLFQDLNCDRWYFNVSACCCGVGPIELPAIFLRVGLRLRVGVADPSRETGVACACACLRGIETAVAFARR